jgi:hypothetical protein
MELLAGIDLHSNNGYLGIADMQGKRVYDKKLPNDLPRILTILEPYRQELKGIVAESIYNWYWLVDGLMDRLSDFPMNPPAVRPYKIIFHFFHFFSFSDSLPTHFPVRIRMKLTPI